MQKLLINQSTVHSLLKSANDKITQTLLHRHDVPNVNFLPSTTTDMTMHTSSQKDTYEGVLYYYAG